MTSGSSSIGSSRVLPVLHDCRRALKVWHGVGWFVVGCRVLGGRMAGWGPVPREVHKLSEAVHVGLHPSVSIAVVGYGPTDFILQT